MIQQDGKVLYLWLLSCRVIPWNQKWRQTLELVQVHVMNVYMNEGKTFKMNKHKLKMLCIWRKEEKVFARLYSERKQGRNVVIISKQDSKKFKMSWTYTEHCSWQLVLEALTELENMKEELGLGQGDHTQASSSVLMGINCHFSLQKETPSRPLG